MSLAFCLATLKRYQYWNGFQYLAGERYDAVITSAILEHWFKVFTTGASWTEVGYFFPYQKTIANTDALFLLGIFYTPFRLAGCDPFFSLELVGLILSGAGFVGAYLLSEKVFRFSFFFSVLVAVLFVLSNGMTVHGHRVQLATVALSPFLGLLTAFSGQAFFEGKMRSFMRYGCGASVLFGAWCLTCFYMAWFYAFFLLAAGVAALVWLRRDLRWIKTRLAEHAGSVAGVLLAAAASLTPFIYVFLPKSREVGVRPYQEALFYTVPPEGILQVGTENILFGCVYNAILSCISPWYAPAGEYYNTGFPPLIFALFVFGCVHLFGCGRTGGNRVLYRILASATVLTWVMILNIRGYSLWYFVYHLVPGAKALRVVAAYQIFLALPVVIVAVRHLADRRLAPAALLAVCGLLAAEELNKPPLYLDRKAELARIALPVRAPDPCKVFYVSGWEGQEGLGLASEFYPHNVTAIFMAQVAHLPTINGFASFNPPDWDFAHPNAADYEERVFYYARKHSIEGLCRLDLNHKQWTVVDPGRVAAAGKPVNFFRTSAWPGQIFDADGLSWPEPWGTWSNSDAVTLQFSRPLPENTRIHLVAHAFGPNAGKEFIAQIGDSSVGFVLNEAETETVLVLSNPHQSDVLTIRIPESVSPKSLGLGGDDRRLGIGIHAVTVLP